MGRGPKRKTTKQDPAQAATERSHHSPIDRENLSPLLTSII